MIEQRLTAIRRLRVIARNNRSSMTTTDRSTAS